MDVEASPTETLEALLSRSGRESIPIRRSFVQIREPPGGAGPLAAFVSGRQAISLDLYLLGRVVASREPFDVALPARVWARALGLGGRSSAAATISQSWSWLEEQRLVVTRRRGRLREVVFLREDGSGRPYTHPAEDGDYFKFPLAYWEGRYPGRLSLPAKALLLIASSLGPDFWLPHERGARWYGLSRDTVARGLSTLLRLGLLEVRYVRKKAPLSPRGYTDERRYALRAPFGSGFHSATGASSVAAARRNARSAENRGRDRDP